MSEKAFVITGASTGIGRSAALHLDRLGQRVFAGVRKPSDADALRAQGSARLVPITIDVASSDSIAAAARTVDEALAGAPLDGLVNNAGVSAGGPLEFADLASVREVMEINVIGLLAVTQAFLPALRRGSGRIVNVSSVSGRFAAPFVGPYAASKHAVEALSDSLRVELAPWNMSVSIIEPGPVESEIWAKAQTEYDAQLGRLSEDARVLYGSRLERLRTMLKKSERDAIPTRYTDRVIEHALLATRPKARYPVGGQAKLFLFLQWLLPGWLLDRIVLAN